MTITEGRRCALPGCYVVIEPEPDGRPQRKYCTAAHRAVARQMRREGIHRSASAPPLPLPAPPMPLPPVAAPLPAARRRRELTETTARRARAMAVLGSAGLLVTGGGLMAASAPIGLPGSTISAAPWLAATPEAEKNWAEQARVSLASLETQLAEVHQAEQSWDSLPEARRADPVPAAVRALAARRTLLEQQRATLISELATWDSMNVANRRLADTEAHVARLDRALMEVPRGRALTRPEADTAAQLGEQRNLRVRQRDSQREELDNLRQGLHEAMASPLPDDPTATKVITSRVADLARNPNTRRTDNRKDPLTGQRRRPDVTAQREHEAPERRDVDNGAPPVPGTSGSELPRRSDILAEPDGQPKKDDPAKPREQPRAPDAKRGEVPGPGNGRGLTDRPLDRPVQRTSQDTALGPTESGTPKTPRTTRSPNASPAPKATRTVPSGQRRSTPRADVAPRTTGSGGDQRARDASRISGAVSRGDMDGMVSGAMAARRHQNQASGSKQHSGRSGYASSGSGASSKYGSARRSPDAERMAHKYRGGGSTKRARGSFFGSSGTGGSAKSYQSSGRGSWHSGGGSRGFGGLL